MADKQLTSIKLPEVLFDEFRILSVRTKINLQKLAERSMYLYLTDKEFRDKINSTLDTHVTGSNI